MDLTKDEAYAIAEMIDIYLFDMIRNDTDMDSFYWLRSVCRAYEKLAAYCGYVGLTDKDPEGVEDNG